MNHIDTNTTSPITILLPLQIHRLSEADAIDITHWRYEPPYDAYNLPPWEKLKARRQYFADALTRREQFMSICDANGLMIGFVQYAWKEACLRIGLGIRPDCTGQGLSAPFMELVVREARRRAPWQELELHVATWNKRAIRAYKKAGFVVTSTLQRRIEGRYEPIHAMCYRPHAQHSHG